MTMTEKQAREVAGILDLLDDLAALREDLAQKKREFYIAAQDEDECLNSSMSLPAESGLVFVDGITEELRKKLVGYGVVPSTPKATP